MFFIDESGSIPKVYDPRFKNRFFVISFVHTENPKKLFNTYKHTIQNLKKWYPDFFSNLRNPNELKGSEAPPFMKLYIIERLLRLTDIQIAHMVVDNWSIDQRFRDVPGRSFNFLIKLILEHFPLTSTDKEHLFLRVDNRNTKLEGLKELEWYLYNELILESNIVKNVTVEYLESSDNRGIQIADIISSVIYQRYRYQTIPFSNYNEIKVQIDTPHPYTYEYLYNFLRPRMRTPYVFPVKSRSLLEASATI